MRKSVSRRAWPGGRSDGLGATTNLWAGTLAGAIALVLIAAPARAACTYASLASGTAAATSSAPQLFTLNQSVNWWTAIGVRGAAADNWNMEVFRGAGVQPDCVTGLLGSSSRSAGVDFVIGDFNAGHDALGLYYARATRVAGTGSAAVEWDGGGGAANTLTINAPLVQRTAGAGDVLEVWDVYLSAGALYTFTFNASGADLRLLLFQSRPGVYWVGRDSAQFETAVTRTFTPSASGYYGLVVVNDNGAAGSYSVGIGRCLPPDDLLSGTPVATGGVAEKLYQVNQHEAFWTAIGARGTANWNVRADTMQAAGEYPDCFGSPVATSAMAAPSVDLVVANFNNMVTTPFLVRVFLDKDLGSGSATVEWDGAGKPEDIILVNGATIHRTTGAGDVLECWDVYLEAGVSYQVFFDAVNVGARFLLFRPSLSWGGRGDAAAQWSSASAARPYIAPETGWYGVVVVNDDGGSGSYDLRVMSGNVAAVVPGLRPPTQFGAITPNPALDAAVFSFSLHDAADVGFDILDVTGRRVSDIPARPWEPGQWKLKWSRTGSTDGRRLAPGVYFVRMRVDHRVLALRKLTLLD